MNKIIILLFVCIINLYSFDKNIKSQDFNLNLIKYVLSNSIHKNLDIKSVDKWYLYIENSTLYNELKNDDIKLNKEISLNFQNYQKDIFSISQKLRDESFYYEKLYRLADLKEELDLSNIIQKNSYFVIDSALENKFKMVGRFYLKNINTKSKYRLKEKTDAVYLKYNFKISDVRLNSLKDGFKQDIGSLNLDIDVFINIESIEVLDFNKKRIDI